MTTQVQICEVGMRDGLQAVKTTMSTTHKKAWLDALVAAGLREIEATSFVPARLLPQLADAAEIVAHAKSYANVSVTALVPNLKGAHAVISAGVHKITIPCLASEAHSLANVRKTRQEMITEVHRIFSVRNETSPKVNVQAAISTAFGCTLQGAVSGDDVLWSCEAVVSAGADEIGLADTTGMANPSLVRRRFEPVGCAVGRDRITSAHMHNTRGLGLANCVAAYDVGIRGFDSSLAGTGGGPHAPGATGNVANEDLVFMFEAMGIKAGINIEALMRARATLREGLPAEPLYGMLENAGLPKGFFYA